MKNILCLVISFSLALTACSIQVSKGNVYQEPVNSERNATIRLKNKNFIQATAADIAYMPRNTLDFQRIDGRPVSIFKGDVLSISPGKHAIQISCSTNFRVVGSSTIIFTTLPGHAYEISYPKELHGYEIDYTACQKVIVKSV